VNVFLLSALFGHPLLIPEVAGMFFVALGLTAAQRAAPARGPDLARSLALAAMTVYAVSLLWRVRF